MQGIAAHAGPEPMLSAAPSVQGNPSGFGFKTLHHHSQRLVDGAEILAEGLSGLGAREAAGCPPSFIKAHANLGLCLAAWQAGYCKFQPESQGTQTVLLAGKCCLCCR